MHLPQLPDSVVGPIHETSDPSLSGTPSGAYAQQRISALANGQTAIFHAEVCAALQQC